MSEQPPPFSILKPATKPLLKMIIQGIPGTGKTTLAATAPNVLVLDVDDGLESVAGWDISYVPIGREEGHTVTKDMTEVYKFLLTGEHPYETVVIDTISELQAKLVEQLQREIHAASGRDLDTMTLQDWGKITSQTRRLVRAFVDLPMHVILVAQTELITDDSSRIQYLPLLTPKARISVMAMVGTIGYMGVKHGKEGEDTKRILLTQPHDRYYAKCRFRQLPAQLENPTIPQMLDIIWGPKEEVST